jgi:drug/metabolite transporter (DMT)-like permease
MTSAAAHSPTRLALFVAFAIVYVVWGSTYLAIRFAIETLPPFLMASARFFVAGAALYAWARIFGGAVRPNAAQWRATAVVGVLLLLGGNGLVVWAEHRVPSGIAALIIGIEPCIVVLLDWLRPTGVRPTRRVVAGLVLGLVGLVWLVGPDTILGGGRIDFLGAVALVLASLSWAVGSIYSRHASMPSPFLSSGMQMLAGAVSLLLLGVALGEPASFEWAAVSLKSVLGWIYLIVFGSIVGFSTYIWLLRVTTLARASTYAYVNPVVAVVLGWLLADEPLTLRMLVAVGVIVSGVALITLAPRRA